MDTLTLLAQADAEALPSAGWAACQGFGSCFRAVAGTSIWVFSAVTLVIMGFAAFSTGQAMAANWKPLRLVVFYTLLLGIADRFLTWALFQGALFSLSGYVLDTAVIAAIALVSYQATRASKMVSQYPWLYQRAGLFSWKEKS